MNSCRLLAASALFGFVLLSTGCVVHEREVVHDPSGSYAEGYKEGYYDREHNRYYHEKVWVNCTENDPHCR